MHSHLARYHMGYRQTAHIMCMCLCIVDCVVFAVCCIPALAFPVTSPGLLRTHTAAQYTMHRTACHMPRRPPNHPRIEWKIASPTHHPTDTTRRRRRNMHAHVSRKRAEAIKLLRERSHSSVRGTVAICVKHQLQSPTRTTWPPNAKQSTRPSRHGRRPSLANSASGRSPWMYPSTGVPRPRC